MLDFLLRNWLRQTATQHVYRAARQAAFDQLNQAAEEPASSAQDTPQERACDVGVVFARDSEAGSFEDRLDGVLRTHAGGFKFCSGGLRGRHVVFVTGGGTSAAQATELLIAGHRPQWVLCAGFACALSAQLSQGDFFMATEVVDCEGRSLTIDLGLPPADASRKPRVHGGRLLSTEQRAQTVADKAAMARLSGAAAFDRESFAVAQTCRQEKTRFLSVRILSDAPPDELPPALQRAAGKKSQAARWGAALGAIVHRPSSVKEMLELKEHSLIHADALAKFLEGVIVQLSPLDHRAATSE